MRFYAKTCKIYNSATKYAIWRNIKFPKYLFNNTIRGHLSIRLSIQNAIKRNSSSSQRQTHLDRSQCTTDKLRFGTYTSNIVRVHKYRSIFSSCLCRTAYYNPDKYPDPVRYTLRNRVTCGWSLNLRTQRKNKNI